MSALAIPKEELVEFGGLPEKCRKEVWAMLRVMERLLGNGARGIQALIEREARALGMAAKTLRKDYDAFRRTEDWRVLIDRRRWPQAGHGAGVPAAVVELFRGLCERNQRKCKPAYRELIRMFQRGEPSGFAWPEVDPFTGVPRGCTYRNLMRQAPTRYESTAARIGRSAASAMLPPVLTTRVGLKVGQLYVCDDQKYDVYVGFTGVNRKMLRPAGFNTLDFASAAEIRQGYKPVLDNADGSRTTLRQIDYHWHLVTLLTTIGYREDTGTVIFGEHGTAKAGKEFEERVRRATGGKVTFDAGGIHGEQIAGMFRGQARGNPRAKAARESWFNLLRNEMGALPAPTGKDREHAPEESYGMQLYARDLMDAITAQPELREKLQFPMLLWHEFVWAVEAIVRQINLRTDHALEGWAGREAREWRLSLEHPWTPAEALKALPAPKRALADALITSTEGLWRVRKLSPLEVWEQGRGELTRVQGPAIPILLGEEGAQPARVTDDHQLVIQDMEISPEPMWFDAALTNGRILEQRQEVRVYLNPFLPEALEVCDAELRWLGTAPRNERIGKLEADRLQHRYGEVRRIERRLLAPVAARGADQTRRRTAMHANNASVLGGEPRTREQAASDRELAVPLDAFLRSATGSTASPETEDVEAGCI